MYVIISFQPSVFLFLSARLSSFKVVIVKQSLKTLNPFRILWVFSTLNFLYDGFFTISFHFPKTFTSFGLRLKFLKVILGLYMSRSIQRLLGNDNYMKGKKGITMLHFAKKKYRKTLENIDKRLDELTELYSLLHRASKLATDEMNSQILSNGTTLGESNQHILKLVFKGMCKYRKLWLKACLSLKYQIAKENKRELKLNILESDRNTVKAILKELKTATSKKRIQVLLDGLLVYSLRYDMEQAR